MYSDLRCLLWRPADWLLAENMLSGRCGRLDDLQVQIIGRGDIHDLHIGMRDNFTPARCGRFKAEHVARLFRSLWDVVRSR